MELTFFANLFSGLVSRRIAVVGTSMFPLLHPHDTVLCNPRAYRSRTPARGDIVVVSQASSPSGRMIKLVAGLPGELIEVRQDLLWVDGTRVSFHSPLVGSLPGRWRVKEDQIFLLSYAVAVGTDSRSFGPIPLRQVLGKVWYVLRPSPRAGRLTSVAMELE
jgi:signal peptidase I